MCGAYSTGRLRRPTPGKSDRLLGLNADYDRMQEWANHHFTIRQMLGHSDFAEDQR